MKVTSISVCLCLLGPLLPVLAQGYTFTKIADDTASLDFGVVQFSAINDQGDVVFAAGLRRGGEAILVGRGDETSLNDYIVVVDTSGPFDRFSLGENLPAINSSKQVAFWAALDDGTSGVFRGDGTEVTLDDYATIIRTQAPPTELVPFVSINKAGRISFSTAPITRDVLPGTYAGTGAEPPLRLGKPTSFPHMNEDGTVVVVTTGEVSTINPQSTVAQAGPGGLPGSFNADAAINDRRDVVFMTTSEDMFIHRTCNGRREIVADTTNSFDELRPNLGINNAGSVAFQGRLLGSKNDAIFVVEPDGVMRTVITEGERALGGTIKSLNFSPHAINSEGQIAFSARIEQNGVEIRTIVRADPTFVPGSGLVLPTNHEMGPPWMFILANDAVCPILIDPSPVTGFDYRIDDGPNFSSVEVPPGVGDNQYELHLWDTDLGQFVFNRVFAGGERIVFGEEGADRFRILGIEPPPLIDRNDPEGFPTAVTFLAGGSVKVTMIPIPEPSGGALALIGSALLCSTSRRARPSPRVRIARRLRPRHVSPNYGTDRGHRQEDGQARAREEAEEVGCLAG